MPGLPEFVPESEADPPPVPAETPEELSPSSPGRTVPRASFRLVPADPEPEPDPEPESGLS